MKNFKKIVAVLVIATMFAATPGMGIVEKLLGWAFESTTVSAASYPTIYNDDCPKYVQVGKSINLNFTNYSYDENESYHIEVYKGEEVVAGNLMASTSGIIDNNVDEMTISLDTTGFESGLYTIAYYTTNPADDLSIERHSHLRQTYVYMPGQTMNSVLNTDIKAFVDGSPIRSYNIDNDTYIVAEDLAQFGFSVVYNNDDRSLVIEDAKGSITSSYQHTINEHPVGSKAMDVYYTDITTYVVTNYGYKWSVDGCNVDGLTLIKMDELYMYGNLTWDGDARTISFNRR